MRLDNLKENENLYNSFAGPRSFEVNPCYLSWWEHGSWDFPLHKGPKSKYDMDAYLASLFWRRALGLVLRVGSIWSKTTLNFWMMVERCPNLKGKGLWFNSRLWYLYTRQKTCQMVNWLLCFGVGMSAFCLQKKWRRLVYYQDLASLIINHSLMVFWDCRVGTLPLC